MEGKTNLSMHLQAVRNWDCWVEIIDVGCNLKQFDGLTWVTLTPVFYNRSTPLCPIPRLQELKLHWSAAALMKICHAWHAPLDEFPTACHVQVMSADIQVSARSGTWLPVALLHVTDLRSWPSSVTFQLTQTNCWYHGPARPALDCVPSVLLVRLPGMICRLICTTWTYL